MAARRGSKKAGAKKSSGGKKAGGAKRSGAKSSGAKRSSVKSGAKKAGAAKRSRTPYGQLKKARKIVIKKAKRIATGVTTAISGGVPGHDDTSGND